MNTQIDYEKKYKKLIIALSIIIPVAVAALFGIKIKGFELDKIENFQFTKYELNGHYEWHTDSMNFDYYAKRFCSVVIQLNNEYDGGELLYKDHNDDIVEFKKGVGNLFIFNSSTLHKVNPIIRGERYSLVSWISLKEISNFKKTLI